MTLIIHHYTKKIGKKLILDDVCLNLSGNMVYGLRGVNGSGKTMLIRAICGLIYPNEGYVEIDDMRIGRDISFPDSLGVLIESPSFLPEFSAFDNLKLISSIRKTATKEDIVKALTDVGLDTYSPKKYGNFSFGMKQKLGIAAAIFEKPSLLLLDEPFNGLDESSVKKTKELIRSLKNNNRIIILACHDFSILNDISDEIIEISDGKIK